ncbi:hypothetical protein FOC28_18985 [Burkholderia cenocepacia]|uniref:hypothetical protein n=1 Tax=Burkholderia cenocepacia TaxID=95486 RepID=UPI00143ECDFF|nr:hypothetical protein [Burkholderia cenocepacia]QIY41761.1 hypothetical protein FOC28_18985 [Burkholderia cenocepacia]
MKLSQGTHEQTVEALLDAAGKVLEATYEDEQRSRQAITSLERLRTTVEEKVGTLSRDTVKLIEGSSEATATQAAKLLREKFVEADVAAEHARARYVRATHSLGWRLFGLAVLVQLLIFVGVWVIVARTLPSQDDIAARRQTLQELAQQISGQQSQAAELDRQIKAKQRKVNDLDRRGGARVEWTTCSDSEQVSHLCFRTDDQAGDFTSGNGGKTFRVPWGY